MQTHPRRSDRGQPPRPTRLLATLALLCLLLIAVPRSALTELRPLVPEMLDNLSSINRIGEAVALEDFEQVEQSARALMQRADAMRDVDLASVGVDPARKPQWDAFLMAQRESARLVESAAAEEDATAVMKASRDLFGNACLGCHASFRDPARLLLPSVHVMTGFLATWRDMNRGLAVNDFNLIEVRARELATLTGVIATDEMIESAFGIGGSKTRRQFRGFLREVTQNAERIEAAAQQEDLAAVLDASQGMWTDGCLACHAKFRR